MNKYELDFFVNIKKSKDNIITKEHLKPFLKNRTLIYGYTCDKKTFHVYLKDCEVYYGYIL